MVFAYPGIHRRHDLLSPLASEERGFGGVTFSTGAPLFGALGFVKIHRFCHVLQGARVRSVCVCLII